MEFHCDRNGQLKVTLSKDGYCTVGDLKRDILKGLAHGGSSLTEDGSGFYLLHQGKRLDDDQANLELGGGGGAVISVIPRVLGGKGGFGSMLRAIGAQIEKTTNRDACRDLSGRRLRDINEEQRLKKWYAKQKERELARKEAKKVKLAKLRQFADGPALPKIEDQAFLQKREDIEESVYEAVDQGFGSAQFKSEPYGDSNDASNSSSSSDQASGGLPEKIGSSEETPGPSGASSSDLTGTEGAVAASSASTSKGEKKTMRKTMFDEDLDTDSSTDESEDDAVPPSKKTKKN